MSDTGAGRGVSSYEEVNGPLNITQRPALPPTFGFPCMTSRFNNSAYTNLSSSLCANPDFRLPLYAYSGATFNSPSASISALGYANGRL